MNVPHQICPNCSFENSPGAVECRRCKTILQNITTITIVSEDAIESLQSSGWSPRVRAGEFTFYVSGYPDPVVINLTSEQDEIMIGRRSDRDPPHLLDLTSYEGVTGGVSRHHAVIRTSKDDVTIEDLNSTNGSWLNGNQLEPYTRHPLHPSDLLQIGHLYVFVYFLPGSEKKFKLTENSGETTSQHTPIRLITHIGEYLNSILNVQTILNEAIGHPAAEVFVKNLDVNRAIGDIEIEIIGAPEAINLIARAVLPWRLANKKRLIQLWQDEQATNDTGASEALRNSLAADQMKLIRNILTGYSPSLSETALEAYSIRLLPHIYDLAFDTLDLAFDIK